MGDLIEPDLLQIDWRGLKEALAEPLRDATGVVHVRVDKVNPPEATFIRTLVEVWLREHWPHDRVVVIHVEPDDPATRHTAGIAARIVKDCGLRIATVTEDGERVVEMFRDLDAGGNIEITNNDVRVELNCYGDWKSVEPLDVVRAGLAEFLTKRRLVLIFREQHQLQEFSRAQLGRDLWSHCLAPFEHSGVLLVCLYDRASGLEIGDDTGWPPPATTTVDLQTKIDPADEPHAVDDVAQIALSKGWYASTEEARAFAEGQVLPAPSMRLLHTQLRIFGTRRPSPDGKGVIS